MPDFDEFAHQSMKLIKQQPITTKKRKLDSNPMKLENEFSQLCSELFTPAIEERSTWTHFYPKDFDFSYLNDLKQELKSTIDDCHTRLNQQLYKILQEEFQLNFELIEILNFYLFRDWPSFLFWDR